ncbi:MAG: formate dehydrogenase subunit alpha [Candidatus Schekmanbacteria bacterium]|nr:formate dehydrogenase subunit alpha [Candidatus Schekmanbacteria bacterium]
MSKKINLIINEIAVEAGEGDTILAAARKFNIYIPTLCYSPHLTLFGACRLCLVEVNESPRLVSACTTPVAEGMSVKTDTPQITGIRKTLLEMLLLEHPLDCLTCDKGGECELQNLAFRLQVTEDRFGFHAPLTKNPDETNCFIQRDLQKCMLCGKCVRVCDEIRNIGALGYTRHGMMATIGYPEKKLVNCEFCGQCLAVCPVGALSSKLSKFEARPWEMEQTNSVCPYCGCGCSLVLRHKNNKVVKISTNDELGGNEGLLCVKGRFGYDFINHPTRLTNPLIKKDGVFTQATWDEAIQYVADKLKLIFKEKGGQAIAAIASTRCTNEENYLFQKLMRAVFKTNNIDNYARLEHAPSMTVLQDVLGVPAATNSIQEVKTAQTILVIGANPTSSHVIMGLAIKQAVRNCGANLILVDPVCSNLVPFAKSWLQIKPGTDTALLNGLARIIIDENLLNKEFVEKQTKGLGKLVSHLQAFSPESVAQICNVSVEELEKAARLFAQTETACIVYGDGLVQQVNAADNVYALLNLLLLTGNLGRKGTGIHPLRTSCNVQGACDVGALPDYLPGYQDLRDEQVREKFELAWNTQLPSAPGLSLMGMIDAAIAGKITAMYIIGENTLTSFPQKNNVKKALESLDFLVVQDIFLTETAQLADVVLPAAAFAEKTGTYTNTERRIQKINQAVLPIGESKSDRLILQMVAKACGYEFKYNSAADVMKEISELSPIYSGIRYQSLGSKGLQWPLSAEGKSAEYLAEFKKPLSFHPVQYVPLDEDKAFPFVLISGGLLFHHLSGTMSNKTRGLQLLCPEPRLEMNPVDAERLRIQENAKVLVENCADSLAIQVKINNRYPSGVVFLPKHFSSAPVNLFTGCRMNQETQTQVSKLTRVNIRLLDE